jgi:hypothetical protein
MGRGVSPAKGQDRVKKTRCKINLVAVCMLASAASAQQAFVDSELADAYHYVEHYEVLIDGTPEEIWPHILDVGSWMPGVDMIHVSGPHNGEGAVFRLYEGEEFFFEITKLIPGRLLVGVNLPSEMEGEASVGVAMFTLTRIGSRTLVSNFMSRHFGWSQAPPNPMRARRESDEFSEFSRTMQKAGLGRLKERVETRQF